MNYSPCRSLQFSKTAEFVVGKKIGGPMRAFSVSIANALEILHWATEIFSGSNDQDQIRTITVTSKWAR